MKKFKYLFILLVSFLVSTPVYAYTKVTCGKIQQVPLKVLEISNLVVNVMQVAVPILLVLLGAIDFLKATAAQKEDEIKNAQAMFIKRLIVGALVFFIFVIVKFIIGVIGGNTDNIVNCMNCFINNANSCK